jgi:hypothetical protein
VALQLGVAPWHARKTQKRVYFAHGKLPHHEALHRFYLLSEPSTRAQFANIYFFSFLEKFFFILNDKNEMLLNFFTRN